MEHNPKKFEYKVGAFVAVGLTAIMLSILALGGNRMVLTKYVYYTTEFTEVSGLFVGSVISLQGVPIGNVRKIGFAPKANRLSLELAVDKKFEDRMKKGSVAEIRTQGALGDKFVFINPGEPTAEQLPDGSKIESTESGDILKMITDKDQGISQVFDLIKELRVLVASLNSQGKPAKVMENMTEMTAQMRVTLKTLDALLREIHGEIPKDHKMAQAMTDLASILQKIDKGQGSLGALINDPSIHQSLKNILGGSQRQSFMKNVLKETIQKSN
jgi:phospholipid/cholesterol/gamma-HCH transport system substrate-binding protein